MERIGFTASEEKSFENVDGRKNGGKDGRTTDACLYYKLTYEPSAQVKKKFKNVYPTQIYHYITQGNMFNT